MKLGAHLCAINNLNSIEGNTKSGPLFSKLDLVVNIGVAFTLYRIQILT